MALGAHIWHTSTISSGEIKKHVSCESSVNRLQNGLKTDFWLNFDPIQFKKDPKIWHLGPYFIHTSNYPYYACEPSYLGRW